MSTTLRTLICSCQYLHEGDPRAALVLTHHVCTVPHAVLRFRCGNRGGVSVSRRGEREGGREAGPPRKGRQEAAECGLHEFSVTAED